MLVENREIKRMPLVFISVLALSCVAYVGTNILESVAKSTPLTDDAILEKLKCYSIIERDDVSTVESQLSYVLVKSAFEAKWKASPWTEESKPLTLRVWLGDGGRVVRYEIESSSGNVKVDQSMLTAASKVGFVTGLTSAYIDKYKSSGVSVCFTVRP